MSSSCRRKTTRPIFSFDLPRGHPDPAGAAGEALGHHRTQAAQSFRLLVDRALARRQDDGSILLHDLQGDFVRKRCPDLLAAHSLLLNGYRKDEATAWVDIADD